MGFCKQQPSYNQSFTKVKRGITGPQGPPGPPSPAGAADPTGPTGPRGPTSLHGATSIGFNHTADGNYDMTDKKLTNMAKGTASSDAVTKNQLDTAVGYKHGSEQNIDLRDTCNVIKVLLRSNL